jgi:hypothetical protein
MEIGVPSLDDIKGVSKGLHCHAMRNVRCRLVFCLRLDHLPGQPCERRIFSSRPDSIYHSPERRQCLSSIKTDRLLHSFSLQIVWMHLISPSCRSTSCERRHFHCYECLSAFLRLSYLTNCFRITLKFLSIRKKICTNNPKSTTESGGLNVERMTLRYWIVYIPSS